jgi:hypothetical protein
LRLRAEDNERAPAGINTAGGAGVREFGRWRGEIVKKRIKEA